MSEGGIYPWKVQKVQQPRNGLPGTCRYADLSAPLPDPPKGQIWMQNKGTKEWSLVPVANATVCEATDDSGVGGEENAACATAVAVAYPHQTSAATSVGIRYHEVLPTDTFQGICLRYKITPTELRRANRMLGNNLKLAPEKLVIPTNEKNQGLSAVDLTKEEKIAALFSKVRLSVRTKLSSSEARAYLEISDWDLNAALQDVNEDFCS